MARKEEERERKKHTLNFLGCRGARPFGCSQHWHRKDRICDWCGLSDPTFLLEEDLSYWDRDHVEDEDLDEFRHWGKRDYL